MKVISFVFLFITCFSFLKASGQEGQVKGIDPRIKEIFKDNMRLIEESPNRLRFWSKLLEERILIEDWGVISDDGKLVKLSSLPLNNKYNAGLERDDVFDLTTLNVLKYDLGFSNGKKNVFHIDSTNYVIIVQPQKFMK